MASHNFSSWIVIMSILVSVLVIYTSVNFSHFKLFRFFLISKSKWLLKSPFLSFFLIKSLLYHVFDIAGPFFWIILPTVSSFDWFSTLFPNFWCIYMFCISLLKPSFLSSSLTLMSTSLTAPLNSLSYINIQLSFLLLITNWLSFYILGTFAASPLSLGDLSIRVGTDYCHLVLL